MAATLHTLFSAIHATLQEQARMETESVEALLFDAASERALTWEAVFEE